MKIFKIKQKQNVKKENVQICKSHVQKVMPYIKFVTLTEKQFMKLVNRYDIDIVFIAIDILNKWFCSGNKQAQKYIGKNNYAHFRSDGKIINEARLILDQLIKSAQ